MLPCLYHFAITALIPAIWLVANSIWMSVPEPFCGERKPLCQHWQVRNIKELITLSAIPLSQWNIFTVGHTIPFLLKIFDFHNHKIKWQVRCLILLVTIIFRCIYFSRLEKIFELLQWLTCLISFDTITQPLDI